VLEWFGESATSAPLLPICSLRHDELVGRAEQLELMGRCLDQVRDEKGAVVLLHGRSGMGKTCLAREFLTSLEGVIVLEGRCYEQESLPYKALDSVVDTLFGYLLHLDREEVIALLPTDVSALAQVFPVLLRVPVIEERATGKKDEAPQKDLRQRAFIALRELLCHISAKMPVVVFVDDLQWGDAESASMFIELMRPPTPHVMLLGAYRDENPGQSSLLSALLSEETNADFRARLTQIEVGRLSDEQSVALAKKLLRPDNAKEADRIAREAEGNAYYIWELARFIESAVDGEQRKLSVDGLILAGGQEAARSRRGRRAANAAVGRAASGGNRNRSPAPGGEPAGRASGAHDGQRRNRGHRALSRSRPRGADREPNQRAASCLSR
jgi:predicted ATPase